MALFALQKSHRFARSLQTIQSLKFHCSNSLVQRRKVKEALNRNDQFVPLDPLALTSAVKYRLAGEKYLPGSHGQGIPEFISNPRRGLPMAYQIVQPDRHSLTGWARLCREMIIDKLPQYGAVLFRGLPLYDGNVFSSFVTQLGFTPKGYEGGAAYRPAYDEKANTFISTLMDKKFNIEPHCDMAYTVDYPHKVFFYCDIPAEDGCGGLTPVALGTEVLKKIHPDVVEKFEKKQVRYYYCLPNEGNGYLPWQVSFRTKDRKEVEKRLQKMGVVYEWRPNNTLSYWLKKPAIITHPITGERVWFNQIDTHHNSYHRSTPMFEGVKYESDFDYPNHTTYGDGTMIELDVLQHIRATKWQNTVCVQLRKNDLIVFDNIKALHGRLSYTGERRILVFMSKD